MPGNLGEGLSGAFHVVGFSAGTVTHSLLSGGIFHVQAGGKLAFQSPMHLQSGEYRGCFLLPSVSGCGCQTNRLLYPLRLSVDHGNDSNHNPEGNQAIWHEGQNHKDYRVVCGQLSALGCV